jgi:predicted thioesterase
MLDTLKPGLADRVVFEVDRERTIDFLGEHARVYATPMLVRDIEVACRNLLLRHIEPGEDSVGTRVNVEHVGPALLGAEVSIDIKVTSVDGRRVTFEATVKDGADDVLRGTHERFVVAVAKVRERLLRKAAQQAQQQQLDPR